MVFQSFSGGPLKVRYGKRFFYKYRLDQLYQSLQKVNFINGTVQNRLEVAAAIEAFLGKLIVFKPRHQPWVKVNKAFCSLDNGVVEILHRLVYCLRYHFEGTVSNKDKMVFKVSPKGEPFSCLISPPIQHKWYSKVSPNTVLDNPVNVLNRTLGDLKLTESSPPFAKQSSENLVNAYHTNMVWLFQEMTQGCYWYKKSIFEDEMDLMWVGIVEE